VKLFRLPTALAVCRLDPAGGLPPWFALEPPLAAAVVRGGELTLVCPEDAVPASAELVAERGWAALEVAGPLDLTLTGVMASLSGALAEAGVALFAVSSFDTDVLLVRARQLADAVAALRAAGHEVSGV
jgi:hypothetical protein